MKYDAKTFEKIYAASQNLMAQQPAAATAAIQQALRQGGQTANGAMPPFTVPPLTTFPFTMPNGRDKAASDAARAAYGPDFVTELLAGLGIPSMPMPDGAGGQFAMPGFDPAAFVPQAQPEPETEAQTGGQFIAGSYSNAAGSRHYKLYIPSCYHGQALPLLVMLHGCTQSPDDFAAGTRMNAIAEQKQCLVVYPAQSQSANSSKCWNWFNAKDQQRDQGEPSLIAGITLEIMRTHKVDARQVYIAGLSAGGAMAVVMGTLYPELYAAVGVHSGLPYAAAHDLPSAMAAMQGGGKSHPANRRLQAIPVIVFHGDKDHTVHPRNGEQVLAQNVPQAVQSATVTVLGPEPKVRQGKIPNGHAYTQTIHERADGHVQAEHWLVHNAGHAWSGGSARGSYTDGKGPDATLEMMRFFSTQIKKQS